MEGDAWRRRPDPGAKNCADHTVKNKIENGSATFNTDTASSLPCSFEMPESAKLPLLALLIAACAAAVSASMNSCPPSHYPAPALSTCVPCSTMFQWQIMGESTDDAITSALMRLHSISKHVQCVTTSGLDCQWGRSELPGSINDTTTLVPLGCDVINTMYFPLPKQQHRFFVF